MARKTAGVRYPHVTTEAREHDHRWCPVIGKIADRVAAGTEQWGTPHLMPPLDSAEQAARIRQGLFRGRDCMQLRRKHGQLSVSVKYQGADGTLTDAPPAAGPYRLLVRAWDRKTAKKEIARRVKSGEALTYNVLREKS